MIKLYNITHSPESDEPIIRIPRSVKVQIGHTKGRAVHAYIDASGKWVVAVGVKKDDTKRYRFTKREEAEKFYHGRPATCESITFRDVTTPCDPQEKHRLPDPVPQRPYPEKLPYFTFTRVGGDGESLVADFDAIEAHGSLPTEIAIMFTGQDPLDGAFQFWQARGLGCSGDGINASCTVEYPRLNPTIAAEAKAGGFTHYNPGKCFHGGCPLVETKECKPHGRMNFQLVNNPRLGSRAELVTTSPKSIAQMFSAITELEAITGRLGVPIVGIPLVLTLRSWKTRYKDPKTGGEKSGTAYALGIEFRPGSAAAMRKELEGHARNWAAAIAPTGGGGMKLLAEAQPEVQDADDDDSIVSPAAIMAEFGGEPDSGDGDDDEAPEPKQRMEAATAENTEKLQERVKATRKKKEEPEHEAKEEPKTEATATASAPVAAEPAAEVKEEPKTEAAAPEAKSGGRFMF